MCRVYLEPFFDFCRACLEPVSIWMARRQQSAMNWLAGQVRVLLKKMEELELEREREKMMKNGSGFPVELHQSVKVPITLNTKISSPFLVVKELPTMGQGGSVEIYEQVAPVFPETAPTPPPAAVEVTPPRTKSL